MKPMIAFVTIIFTFIIADGSVDAQEYQPDSYTKLLMHGNGTDSAISHPINFPTNYDSYTKLMLHCDGTEGSASFPDAATGKVVTAVGNAHVTTAQKKFGTGSGTFDGSGDYLSIPDDVDWNFGSGDWTADFWIKFNSTATEQGLFSQRTDNNNFANAYFQGNMFWLRICSGGSFVVLTGASFTPTVGIWYHVAYVHSGTTYKTFINGEQKDLTADADNWGDYSGDFIIGRETNEAAVSYDLDGWMDDFRISKGITRWTSNFTPPTSPYGKVTLTTSQTKFGSSSARFDGSGSYLSLADRDDWNFGTGDFTIDCWVKFNAINGSGVNTFVSQRQDANGNQWSLDLYTGSLLRFLVQSGGSTIINVSAAWSPAQNTWYHVSLLRTSNNYMFFVDGSQVGTTQGNVEALPDLTGPLILGNLESTNYFLDGWLDEFRISKGTARWTSNFAPPTSPYTTDSKTTLLLHFDGADGDTSTNDAVGGDESARNHIVTYNGNSQLDTVQSKFAGSAMLFDGTGDYLSVADNEDWHWGIGDFTVECWVRFNVLPPTDNYQALWSQVGDYSVYGNYNNYYQFYLYNSGSAYVWIFSQYEDPGPIQTITTQQIASDMSAGRWYHIALVRSGNDFRIFQNGIQLGTTVINTDNVPDFSGPFYLGRGWTTGPYVLNGSIDEFRVSKGIARRPPDFPVWGSINGLKFNDLNRNGAKDGGEPGLSNWKIKLSGAKIESTFTDVNGNYRFDSLLTGTYTVNEERRSGWLQTKPVSPDSYTVVLGTGVDMSGFDFGNSGLDTLTVRKLEDRDGNFTTSGDRVPKTWHLEIRQGSCSGPVVASGDSSSITAINLLPGTYYAIEADSTNWISLGYVLRGTPTAATARCIPITLTDGESVTIDYVNAPPIYSQMFRSFTPAELAEKKAVRKKPAGYLFSAKFINNTNDPANGLRVNFNRFSLTYIEIDSCPPFRTKSTSDHRYWTCSDGIVLPGDSAVLYGRGYPGQLVKITNWNWLFYSQPGPIQKGFTPPYQKAFYPMPNYANVRDTVFINKGFNDTGMVAGIVRKDSARKYGWVRILKSNKMQQSLVDRTGSHTGQPRCFDFVGEKKGLPPRIHNNRLFANLAMLKFNIAASKLGVTPIGLGELIFNDTTSNPLNGMMVKKIALKADTLLMGYYSNGKHFCESFDVFNNINETIRLIDTAFDGPMDTISFVNKLVLKGTRRLMDVPYLHANPSAIPERIIPIEGALAYEIPETYQLNQNYPNPFNPTTTIQFELPEPAFITLKIYNVLGQEITTLIDHELMEDGAQKIEFDAVDLASGVYFYRIVAEGIVEDEEGISQSGEKPFVSVRKMLLLR